MASWTDYMSLTITLSLITVVVYIVLYMNGQIRKFYVDTRNSLHNKGVNVSKGSITLQTRSKLQNRENYLDSTQRGFIKALGAASGGHSANNSPNLVAQAQVPSGLKRRDSAGSHKSNHSLHLHRKSDAASIH